jgi:uridylate kinase
MKKVIVLSLGGSMIVPNEPNFSFLNKFRKTLAKHYKSHKFVIVCGGGTIARKYIDNLKKEHKSKLELSKAGIMATRMNARFMMQFFNKHNSNDTLPMSMKEVKDNLSKNNVVICGALRFNPNATSDTTAAKLANYLNSEFINITNIKGLYSANPFTNKNAKFIPFIDWASFDKIANKIKHKAGQHFVLDQSAAVLIRKHKTKTYIIGPYPNQISNILKGKKFIGTLIKG